MTRIAIVLALAACSLPLSGENSAASAPSAPARPAAEEATEPETNSEVFKNVLVPEGKSVALDSKLDFSKVDRVAVTIRCTTCDSAANSMNSLLLQAFWATSEAEVYAVAETKAGSTFPYWDSGGAMFQVYGSRFRLTLVNRGNQGLLIQQITIFRKPG